jgi:polysaccharide export outer membrane protein
LPAQTIGPNDLIAVSVYDAPEFSRTVRVGADGKITLPLMKHPIPPSGLMPLQLEARIAEALSTEELLKDASVTVTIAE